VVENYKLLRPQTFSVHSREITCRQEVRTLYYTVYRQPRIVRLSEKLQQNMATQRHRMNNCCPKSQLEAAVSADIEEN